jgi:hypothetical protein
MSVRRMLLGAALFGALSLALHSPEIRAADTRYSQSDPDDRLSQVESQVVDKMRELSAARLRNDDDAVQRLTKEFKELEDEQVKLLRATGKLPR